MTAAPPRVLVLGGTGMLGHRLWMAFRPRFETWATVRSAEALACVPEPFADPARAVAGVDAEDMASVERALDRVRPTVAVNAIGMIKRRPEAADAARAIAVNALFPHRLAACCGARGIRLIHVSTDCVFAGTLGGYTEADIADADDLYGRSKRLGEVDAPGCLTVRTSLIGRELLAANGLVEWFLAQARAGRQVPGWPHAIFSGVTTHEAADVLAEVIERHAGLDGVLHVAAEPISKLALLTLLRDALGLAVDLVPGGPAIDRSLDGTVFRRATGWSAPAWPAMVARLARDSAAYDDVRGAHVRG